MHLFSKGSIFQHENAVLGLVLIVIIAAIGLASKGSSFTLYNAINVAMQSATRGVAAIGQTFVILTAGIDLSIGGIALLAMSVAAILTTGTTAIPVGPILLMLVIGIALGSTTGLAVSRIGVPPLVITLALWGILRGVALRVNGGVTIGNLPPSVAFIGQGRIGPMPVVVIIFIVVCVIAYFLLNHSTFGRSVYATGGNPISAWLSGVNTKRVILMVYIISGLCAALAGLIIMSRTMSSSMAAAYNLELDAIAAAVIGGISLVGGRGNVIGVVIGTLIIGSINNGMSILALHPSLQQIVKGAVIYGAVMIDSIRRRS